MSERSYAIVGTGAIGGYYGACLQRAGFDVHFLVHSGYEQIRERGLVIESYQGDFSLPQVKAYQEATEMPMCDVVVVALKTTQNQILPKILPWLVKENSIVLLMQNGLGIEPEIAQILTSQTLVGGLCFICSNKVAPGQICHLDYGAIKLGEYAPRYQPRGSTEALRQLAVDFSAAGIEVMLSQDLLQARWEKLIWNIPFNSLSVILNARTDQMMANTGVRLLSQEIMQEVLAAAKATGRSIPQSNIQRYLEHTLKMKPYQTSMKIDYERQRPLEVEAIVGNPLRMGTSAGADLPHIRMLYHQLKFLDARNCSGAAAA